MASNKRQQPIDKFFTRTRQKGSDGPLEVITTVTETTESFKSEAKLQIPCTFCDKSFGNPGALESHRLMKHQGRREKYAYPKNRNNLILAAPPKLPKKIEPLCLSEVMPITG